MKCSRTKGILVLFCVSLVLACAAVGHANPPRLTGRVDGIIKMDPERHLFGMTYLQMRLAGLTVGGGAVTGEIGFRTQEAFVFWPNQPGIADHLFRNLKTTVTVRGALGVGHQPVRTRFGYVNFDASKYTLYGERQALAVDEWKVGNVQGGIFWAPLEWSAANNSKRTQAYGVYGHASVSGWKLKGTAVQHTSHIFKVHSGKASTLKLDSRSTALSLEGSRSFPWGSVSFVTAAEIDDDGERENPSAILLGIDFELAGTGIEVGYRRMSRDFAPPLRDTSANNVVARHQGQEGINLKLSRDLFGDPLQVEFDVFNKRAVDGSYDVDRHQTIKVEYSTPLGQWRAGTASEVEWVKQAGEEWVDSDLGFELRMPAYSRSTISIRPALVLNLRTHAKYDVDQIYSESQEIERGVKATIDLNVFGLNGLTSEHRLASVSAGDGSAPRLKYVASLSYTAPNGLRLSAKYTTDNFTRDDNYIELRMPITF